MLPRLSPVEPPDLIVSKEARNCLACPHFSYRAGRSHTGDGTCSAFAFYFVHESFLCGAFEELDTTPETLELQRSLTPRRPSRSIVAQDSSQSTSQALRPSLGPASGAAQFFLKP